jgi:RNA polymerase subunit RPABC4/transcription elongation factor Spt4
MHGTWAALVVLVLVMGMVGLLGLGIPGGQAPKASTSGPTAAASIQPEAPPTHGDLLVTSGETYTIEPTNISGPRLAYFQGGNITVDAGGVLVVRDTTLSFVQTPIAFTFTDQGTVQLYNSVVTTDVQLVGVSASAKLNLTVTGSLTAWDSTFAFPGTLFVSGGSAVVTLNGSAVTRNPAIFTLSLTLAGEGDTMWAPTIQVVGGAHMNLFASQVEDVYADNWTTYGVPVVTTGSIFNITVSGAGTVFSAVDSAIGVNWAAPTPAFPWISNKLLFTFGATGYLANITTPTGFLPKVGTAASAVLPDPSSQVYFYRWAQFNLTGRDPALAIQGAHVATYYAYDTIQVDNHTANALNNLAVTDPAIWGYVQYRDAQHGASAYGSSNALGEVSVLLTAGNLTASSLPNGYFLGDYHVGISVPAISIPSNWFNWSVSPYPMGVANGTSNYNGPDFGPAQRFAGYFGALTVAAVNVTANTTLTASVRIGQLLGFWVSGTDGGTATITQIGGTAWYNTTGTGTPVATFTQSGLDLNTPGQKFSFNLTWVMNDSTTGLNGTFTHPFLLTIEWNRGVAAAGGGAVMKDVDVTIEPSQIRFLSFSTPSSTTLDLTSAYASTLELQYNGSHPAMVELFATPTSGGSAIEIAVGQALRGVVTVLPWSSLSGILSAGTSYTLTAVATYNGVPATYNVPGTYTVPAPPSSPASFLTQKILGLPLWLWLAIAAVIVVGIVAFLLLARRQAAGKLVECGECGNLIPEDATVCPKCGAEFEADLIRCSRCASTIPADSKVCPECAAQLLGKPGEGAADPERQGYADFTERYRAEAKRELGDNYSEGAFWDWWKRQPSYTSFSQWKLQQGTGVPRAGMSAPPVGTASMPQAPPYGGQPPRGGGGMAAAPMPVSAPPPASTPQAPTGEAPMASAAPLKACPNCGKEIPPEYLVCPFCGAVTQ